MGAPNPFEKQTMTVSAAAAYEDSAIPVAALAFQSRAPSRCTGTFRRGPRRRRPRGAGAGRSPRFPSSACSPSRPARPRRRPSGRRPARLRRPPREDGRGLRPSDGTCGAGVGSPPLLPCEPCGCRDEGGWRRRAWPWMAAPISLPMEPVGTKSARSLPRRAAVSSSRRLTEGSSRVDVVPDLGVRHGAAHAGVGRVTVSLRRST